MVYAIYDQHAGRYVGRDPAGRYSSRGSAGSRTVEGAAHFGSRSYAEAVARPFGAEVHPVDHDDRAALL